MTNKRLNFLHELKIIIEPAMQQKLESLQWEFLSELKSVENIADLEELKKDFLGKKWKLQDILKWIKDLSVEEKKIIGPLANTLKNTISEQVDKKAYVLEEAQFEKIESDEAIDVSLQFPSHILEHKK